MNRAGLDSKSDVLLADVNHYRVNELQAADRTLEQIIRFYLEKARLKENLVVKKTEKPSANILGIFTLGFHNQHDCRELRHIFLLAKMAYSMKFFLKVVLLQTLKIYQTLGLI